MMVVGERCISGSTHIPQLPLTDGRKSILNPTQFYLFVGFGHKIQPLDVVFVRF